MGKLSRLFTKEDAQMVSKHRKRSSISKVIGETEMKRRCFTTTWLMNG